MNGAGVNILNIQILANVKNVYTGTIELPHELFSTVILALTVLAVRLVARVDAEKPAFVIF